MIELDFDEVNAVADKAARAAARRVSGSCVEDLKQDCWIWIMSHEHKLEEWLEEDESYGRIYVSLYHHCLEAAQQDRAQKYGYSSVDIFYYSLGMLRKILPWWFEETPGEPPYVLPDRDVALDLQAAWKALSVADRRLLERVYGGDPDLGQTYQGLAVEWEISDDAARMRVNRSLRRLQEKLGGERPTQHRRKVKSNAAARAEARHDYSG